MPIRATEKQRYPKEWKAISARIRLRAEDRCEWIHADGSRCNAPDGELIFRDRRNPERWRSPNGNDCGETDPDYYGIKVVLTVAHRNHIPEDNRDENLAAWCQLHHLRHDQPHHQRNAAATRRESKNNRSLFDNATREVAMADQDETTGKAENENPDTPEPCTADGSNGEAPATETTEEVTE